MKTKRKTYIDSLKLIINNAIMILKKESEVTKKESRFLRYLEMKLLLLTMADMYIELSEFK